MKTLDRDPELGLSLTVSRVLAAGLAFALGSMGLGALVAASRSSTLATQATPLAELPRALLSGDPTAYLSFGIIVLLATPALRVAVLLGGYLRLRRWKLAAVSAAVLAILGASLRLGISH